MKSKAKHYGELPWMKNGESFTTKFQLTSIDSLLAQSFDSPKWVVDKLIPSEGITIISAPPKMFKSWIALHIALCVAQGESVFGMYPCSKSSVLIVDEENHLRYIHERLKKLQTVPNLPIFFASQKNFSLTNEEHMEMLLDHCKKESIGVVVLDSLVRLHDADENNAVEMSAVFGCAKSLCVAGITVIILHHERKESLYGNSTAASRMRGSSDISASVDSHLSIRKTKDKNRIIIEPAQLRCDALGDPFEVLIVEEDGIMEFQYAGGSEKTLPAAQKAMSAIPALLEANPLGLSHKSIVQILSGSHQIGEKNIRLAISTLITNNTLKESKGLTGNEKIVQLNSNQP